MRLRLQPDRLESAQEVDDLRTAVVYDDYGQPILVVQHLEPGRIIVTNCHEAAFLKVLDSLGLELSRATTRVIR
jgi:hypothetical protein